MFNMTSSIMMLNILNIILFIYLMKSLNFLLTSNLNNFMKKAFFPSKNLSGIFFMKLFNAFMFLNLVSLVCFSYPVTTTLAFNLNFTFIVWMVSIFLLMNKKFSLGSFLPKNSPWYLIFFLCLIELISISVRPITLCFRLLANMSAGHILLALICKMPFLTWMLGTLFCLLELLVSIVQSFVLLMLTMVYFDEGLSH